METVIPRTIAHYGAIEKLGEGGIGVVYKARDTHLDRFVAIKVLPPDKVANPERKRRFVREASLFCMAIKEYHNTDLPKATSILRQLQPSALSAELQGDAMAKEGVLGPVDHTHTSSVQLLDHRGLAAPQTATPFRLTTARRSKVCEVLFLMAIGLSASHSHISTSVSLVPFR